MTGNLSAPRKPVPECPFGKLYPSQLNRDELFYMKLAYNQAIDAWEEGEVPVGAVIETGGEAAAKARNQVETCRDPTAHAEILAITQACRKAGDWRLEGATLYVTKEPCPMCAGAALLARCRRVVFGARDPEFGGLGGAANLARLPGANHQLDILAGVFEKECRMLLKTFFAIKRRKAAPTNQDGQTASH